MGRERARELRRNSTDAERKLWESLRAKRLGGYKFRRQYPVGQYIVDFVCIEQGLAVEIDGDQHAEQAGYDLERTLFLEGANLQVLRFSNREVLTELTNVEQAIWVALTSLSPTLPQWGREPETREGE